MQYSGITLTPGFIISAATDPQFNYVTVLLHGDGTSAGQNNTFLDSSINNFAVTRNGSTTQGSFAPYSTLWSNYFNGSAGYLSIANNAVFDFGTGDCTFEAWVYIQSYSTSQQIVYSQSLTSGPNGYQFTVTTSGFLQMESQASSVDQAITATNNSIPLNTWTHVAFTRASGTNRLFVNGNICTTTGTFTQAISTGGYPVYIGAYLYSSIGTNYFNGNISNLRLVKGTAVYTAAFTPPTAPLTAITNTSLLTCQTNRFKDNSTNNFAITISGSPAVQIFSPFGTTTQYDPNVNGGSAYFNGSTDYLTAPTGTAFQFAGDFTMEAWVYSLSATGQANYSCIFDTRATNTSSTTGIVVNLTPSGYLNFYINGGNYTSATLLGANNWTHIALVRSGSTISMYQNGVSVASVSYATSLSSGYFWAGALAGPAASGYWQGYISNLRVVNGTAVYTSTFTPPTIPVTSIANTSLLLNFTNAQIFGSAIMNNFVTVGNAQVSTSVYKYGTGSIYFDGTGDWLVPTNLLPLGGGDFTVEMWLYPNATYSATYAGILDSRTSADGAGLVYFGYTGTANQIGWKDNTTFVVTGTVTVSTWNHVAIVRSSGTMTMYINGTSTSSAANSTNYTVAFRLIGSSFDPFSLNGYMDELRFTRGIARYTSNFTAPTSQFPSTGPIPLYTSTVEYLLVAGGAAGGGRHGGGGGAGGVLSSSSLAATLGTTYAITVGAGGAATTEVIGNNGVNSSITTGYSYSFNGSSQYLSLADNAAFNFGTGDATVEFWFNSPGTANNYPGIISGVTYNVSGSASIRFDNLGYKGKVFMYINGGGDPIISSTSSIAYNTWCHVAITRTGTSLKLYLNGVLDTTVTMSVSLGWYLSAGGMRIGRGFDVDGANGYYSGYVSNVRLVKGVVVYTGNFTVPTGPLSATQSANPFGGSNTSAITGTQTSLLTLQNATIVDNSSYGSAITNNGSVAFSTSAPYGTSIISIGGGGGGVYPAMTANTGGSGGGAGSNSGSPTGAAGTAGQGNAGGGNTYNATNDTRPTGGGGGAGGAGTSGTSTVQSNGGVGVVSSITGTSLYWGGGGGGSMWTESGPASAGAGNGGLGGGGGGGSQSHISPASAAGTGGGSALNSGSPGTQGSGVSTTSNGGNGGANTGGGGGGCSQYYAPYSQTGVSGAGGSGVVILRYPTGFALPSSTTGSPTITAVGGYRIYTWTSSGSITF